MLVMLVGGNSPLPAFSAASVPLGWPVAFKPAGSPWLKEIFWPATLVTYSRAFPLALTNNIRLPTPIGVGPPGMVKQPGSSVTVSTVGAVVIAPAGHAGTAGATWLMGALLRRFLAALLSTSDVSAYRILTMSVAPPFARLAP